MMLKSPSIMPILLLFLLVLTALATPFTKGGDLDDLLPEDSRPSSDEIGIHEAWSLVLGKKTLQPDSTDFQLHLHLLKELCRDGGQLPQISADDLKEVRKVADPGNFNNHGIYSALWGNRKVIFKYVAVEKNDPEFLKEIFLLLLVNQVGLGPEFLGVFHSPAGFAIVMERFDGENIKYLHHKEWVTPSTLADIYRIYSLLIKMGIIPVDFQVMVDKKSKAELIDVGAFEIRGITDHWATLQYPPERRVASNYFLRLAFNYLPKEDFHQAYFDRAGQELNFRSDLYLTELFKVQKIGRAFLRRPSK